MVRQFCAFFIVCVMHINMVYSAPISLNIGVFNEHDLYLKSSSRYQVGWQIFNQAAQDAGITIIAQPDAWARSIVSLHSGDLDGIFGAWLSEERKSWANFSLALGHDHIYLFTQPDSSITALSDVDFSQQTVGVSKHSIHYDVAKTVGFKNIYAYVGEEQIYKMLFAGRLDFIIFSDFLLKQYCRQYVNTPFDACFKPVGEALFSQGIHVMYHKSHQQNTLLFRQIDEHIQKMYVAGKIKQIFDQQVGRKEDYKHWEKLYLASQRGSKMAKL